jgi:hypothetical protein
VVISTDVISQPFAPSVREPNSIAEILGESYSVLHLSFFFEGVPSLGFNKGVVNLTLRGHAKIDVDDPEQRKLGGGCCQNSAVQQSASTRDLLSFGRAPQEANGLPIHVQEAHGRHQATRVSRNVTPAAYFLTNGQTGSEA